MNYDLEAMDYKIPHLEEESGSNEHSSGRASRLQVKGILERYRREMHKQENEVAVFKQKLSEAYEKLSKEIELNNSNCRLVEELQQELELERKEGAKVKQVLQSVIENRKHLERQVQLDLPQLSACREQLNAVKTSEELLRADIAIAREELERKSKQHQHLVEELKTAFESRTDNVRLENEKIRLEKALLEKEAELFKIREDNKKLNYLHVENLNLLKQIERLKKGDAFLQASSLVSDENSGRSFNQQPPSETVIGKWKKPQQVSQTDTQISGSKSSSNRTRQFKRESQLTLEEDSLETGNKPNRTFPQNDLSLDECLTIQQRRKEQIQSELTKLTNVKKMTPAQHRAIEDLQQTLYEVNSQIAGLKRKIRHRY